MDDEIRDAWLRAASDLGTQVTAPFELRLPGGNIEMYEAHIHQYGRALGTVVHPIDGPYAHTKSRVEAGYFASNLSPKYRRYDRGLFIATLDDWQWLGDPEMRPAWYTGKPWS